MYYETEDRFPNATSASPTWGNFHDDLLLNATPSRVCTSSSIVRTPCNHSQPTPDKRAITSKERHLADQTRQDRRSLPPFIHIQVGDRDLHIPPRHALARKPNTSTNPLSHYPRPEKNDNYNRRSLESFTFKEAIPMKQRRRPGPEYFALEGPKTAIRQQGTDAKVMK